MRLMSLAALPPLPPEPPDPVQAVRRILGGKFGPRQKVALLLVLEGESLRRAARSAGLADHRSTYRHLQRLGLTKLHEERRRYRRWLADLRFRIRAFKFLSAAEQHFPRYHPLVLFLADTGARLGEAIALRWVDVDLDAGVIRIARRLSSGKTLGPTKTGHERDAELSYRLRGVLESIAPNVYPIPEGALVFPNESGRFIHSSPFRARVFSKIVREALGKGRRFTLQCLRHTWASLHLARGTPIKWIQTQGGWTTAKVLLDTYGHFMADESRGHADALSTPADGSMRQPGATPVAPSALPRSEVRYPVEESASSDSATGPRSPIMHLTEPPPFLRNSDTSIRTGSTSRSRT